MASYSDLVEVTFQDMTAHQTIDGKDILGVVMPYHWGPVDTLKVYDKTGFYEAYPESLPIGSKIADAGANYYDAYAQIKRFFANGGAFVEVYRPILGNKYQGVAHGDFKVMLKYPGALPKQLLGSNVISAKLVVSDTNVSLIAVSSDNSEVVLESWKGQFTDITNTEDGRYTHFTKVLEASQFLMCVPSTDLKPFTAVQSTLSTQLDATDVVEGVTEALISKVFDDIEVSSATLLISPTLTEDFDDTIAGITRKTKVAHAVIGYPTTATFNKDNIAQKFSIFSDKFTILLAARELESVFGEQVMLNGVGGYCGAIANIANIVRVNQMASAKTYGSYLGALESTLSFSDVLDLHEKGITSIYSSKTGPQIFGIHNASYVASPNSYFSKSNVTRVITSVLREVFPLAFEAIHTDTAANPVTRAIFESRVNSIINDNIAQQNLQPDSYADASAAVNTDYLTKGGRELNLILVLHFIGLVEKVKIRIVATDSSVNAEIV